MVLVELRIHRIDLALPEGVIQSVVDRRRSNPEPRRSPAIDDQRNRETTGLLVGRNVFQLGQTLELRYKSIRPVVELIGIRIFEGVLILRAAYAVVDRDVLHRLHIERNSLHVLQILLQPAHQIGRADIPVFQRLQVDRHAPTVESCIGPVGSDERRNTLDRRILQDHFGKFLLLFGHCRERNRLGRLRNGLNDARILHREESLGDNDVKNDGQHQRTQRNQKGHRLVAQHKLQRSPIELDHLLEAALGPLVELPLFLFRFVAQDSRRHHGS